MEMTGETFEKQLQILKAHHFVPVCLSDAVAALTGAGRLPRRAVVITLDDGHPSSMDVALPILKRLHVPATYFIYPALIVGANKDGTHRNLTWDDLRTLQREGMEIACHSMSHPLLTKRRKGESKDDYRERLRMEIVQSKAKLESRLGAPIRYFAYPYGAYNAEVREIVKEAGYQAAFSASDGMVSDDADLLALPRIVVQRSYGTDNFAKVLTWLPLDVENRSPDDGELVPTGTNLITARLSPRFEVVPASVRMRISRTPGTSVYDPVTRTVRFTPEKAITPGVHFATIHARDRSSRNWRYRVWLFQVTS